MRLKVVGCEVLARQLYYAASLTPHVVDIELVAKGLHSEPDRLRAELQRRVAGADAAVMARSRWATACAAMRSSG